MTSAAPTLASSSLMRPSVKDCFSRAAWYSAFSERSPCARASAMALVMAGRSMRLRRSGSSFRFSYPAGVMGVRGMAMPRTVPRAGSAPDGSAVEVDEHFHDGAAAQGLFHPLLQRLEREAAADE